MTKAGINIAIGLAMLIDLAGVAVWLWLLVQTA
jgi:hypothetical protein